MSSPASLRALQEPALLYLILSQLSQQDLLLAQRVCQTWNRLISSDSRLLKIMWLHPGTPPIHANVDEATTQVNPLLQKTFRHIFEKCNFWDHFTVIPDPRSPFTVDMWGFFSRTSSKLFPILKHPTASWRRMLPVIPPPDKLLVHISGEGHDRGGKLLRLNFSNQNSQNIRPYHPSWLTFGMLYDIVKCAWHQGNPHRLHGVRIDFPTASLTKRPVGEWIPQEALISQELRASARSRAGRVRIDLEPDFRSEIERTKAHEEAIANAERARKRHRRIGFCGTEFRIRREVFTDEFHFEDAVSLGMTGWDEVDGYAMLVREASPPPASIVERRFWGMRFGRRR